MQEHRRTWSAALWLAASLAVYGADAPLGAPPGDDLARDLKVPPDLEVTLWAKSPLFFNPTGIDVDERGRIWVVEAVNYRGFNNRQLNPRWHQKGDRVVILEDRDGDGRCDDSSVFVEDNELVAPLGVAVLGRRIVVSCSPRLFVYRRDDNDKVVGREVLLVGWGGFDHDHSLHAVEAGPDGRWYLNTGNAGPHVVTDRSGWTLRAGSWYTGGSPYNTKNTPGLQSDDGRIYTGGVAVSIEPDGTDLHVIGHGFRNPFGSCVDSFGNVWMNDNDDTQSCRTTWLMKYGDCGYNSKDGTRSWQADRRPGQSVRSAHWRQEDPGVIPSGHVYGNGSPTGITYYEGGALGERYAGGLLLSCEAGQNVVWGYPREKRGAGYALNAFPFLTTVESHDPNYVWSKRESDRRKWFRPSDIIVGTDGAVYVADWYDQVVGGHQMADKIGQGAIYRVVGKRVVGKGRRARPPKPELASVAGQIAALRSPAVNVRNAGFRGLVERGDGAFAAVAALRADSNRYVQARAIWLLARMGKRGLSAVIDILRDRDTDEELRVAALRALAGTGREVLPRVLPHLSQLATDPSAAVRREVALLMRDVSAEDARPILLELARGYDGADRWYLEALGTGCEGKEEALYPTFLAALGAPTVKWSDTFADLAWRLHPATAAPAFRDRAFAADLGARARRQAIDALAFIQDRRAALAMLELATRGPEDLRSYAAYWAKHRSSNDWREYGLRGKLPGGAGAVGLTAIPAAVRKEPRFASPLLKRGYVDIDVELTGAKRLWLVVTDGGNGKSCDWADWVDPVLEGPDGEVDLTELKWLAATTGYGEVNVGKNCRGLPLRIAGQEYTRGIGTHADSVIAFDIAGKGFRRLRVRAGLDNGGPTLGGTDYPMSPASVRFFVYADGPSPAALALEWRDRLLDPSATREDRRQAALELVRTRHGGEILIGLAATRRLPADTKNTVAGAIFRNPDLAVRALASEYFDRPGAEPNTLPPIAALLAMAGNAERGRNVFFGEKAACSKCHQVGEAGTELGPDLSRIAEKYDRGALLDAILNPSAAVLAGYEAHLVVAKDGRTLTGVLLVAGKTVILKDASAVRHEIPSAQIAFRKVQKTSLMPDNVTAGLNAREIADLLEFLTGLRGNEKEKAKEKAKQKETP